MTFSPKPPVAGRPAQAPLAPVTARASGGSAPSASSAAPEAASPALAAHPLHAGLRAGLVELRLHLADAQVGQLLAYVDWLAKWNKVYNLTALRDPAEMLTHHLLDSLAAVAPLRRQLAQMAAAPVQTGAAASVAAEGEGQLPRSAEVPSWRLLDVGSGGGLPGVVIAIACPDVAVWCVDTVAKKALFIEQVAAALRLPNLHGIHARVEQLKGRYDVVCSRAFASLPDFVQWSRQALKPGGEGQPAGVWMAMKGRRPADELAALPQDVSVFHVEQLSVPGLNAERCIVWMRPKPLQSP